ncbi:hypothetical protein A2U01_0007584 [Trifolium medium]|uniref:Uncharacterized protein n=1 Tax=Trifolium medium TaxID=97028 RepID=A0A392MKE0_9FABA|nr:hypothetical protein [Trifolium medium]
MSNLQEILQAIGTFIPDGDNEGNACGGDASQDSVHGGGPSQGSSLLAFFSVVFCK